MDSFPETYNDPSWIVSRTLKDWNNLSNDIREFKQIATATSTPTAGSKKAPK